LFAYGIFKVIYAPHKAFKEIVQNPKYIGPILIMILFIAANNGFAYVFTSKTYNEQTLPTASQKDEWTEKSIWWTSNANANISQSNDALSGGYYGNKSIEFSVVNDKQIWMQLNYTEPINLDGYKNMSLRIKPIHPNTTELNSASLYLFSNQDYFYYNLTNYFVSFYNDTWNNLTIAIGPESEWVNSNTNATWSSITDLKFEITWSENAKLTVRLDGLFFRGAFQSLIESGAASYITSVSLFAFMQFIIQWVLLGGLIYIMTKGFGAKTVWKPLLILVGFAFITMFIQAVINTIAFSALPSIYRPFELFGGVRGEFEIAYEKFSEKVWLFEQIYRYVQIGVYVWTIGLCAIAIRFLAELSWTKSFLIAAVAYFVTLIALGFIL